MHDDVPPDLERLLALRTWHALWLDRIDHKITAIRPVRFCFPAGTG